MTSLLQAQVTSFLTAQLGRAPTSSEVTLGMLAPWTLASVHNDLSVGTSVLSINSGESVQTAINEAHAQGGGTVYLVPGTYSLSSNLTIYSDVSLLGVAPDATILDFEGTAFGVVGNGVTDVSISSLSVQNTTGTGIHIYGSSSKISLTLTEANGCGKGFLIADTTEVFASRVTAAGCTGAGYELTNLSLCDWQSANAISNGGNGFTCSGLTNFAALTLAAVSNTGIGVSLTNATTCPFLLAASGNGSDGVKLVSGCTGVNLFSGVIQGNGGYGVNVAAGSNANTIIIGNNFAGNSTAAAHDLGTGTLIRSNIGLADN